MNTYFLLVRNVRIALDIRSAIMEHVWILALLIHSSHPRMCACLVGREDIGMEQHVQYPVPKDNIWTLCHKHANVRPHWTGTERDVSHAQRGRYSPKKAWVVSALDLWSGMGLPVHDCLTVKMGRSGMYIPIRASALSINTGHLIDAEIYRSALMEGF